MKLLITVTLWHEHHDKVTTSYKRVSHPVNAPYSVFRMPVSLSCVAR